MTKIKPVEPSRLIKLLHEHYGPGPIYNVMDDKFHAALSEWIAEHKKARIRQSIMDAKMEVKDAERPTKKKINSDMNTDKKPGKPRRVSK